MLAGREPNEPSGLTGVVGRLGLAIDRLGLLGSAAQGVSTLKVLGVLLILAGGILVVRY